MNLVAKLIIDDQHYIEVLVPPFGEKENSFCDPTPLLHNCDCIVAYLVAPSARYIVYKDILQLFLSRTVGKLIDAQDNKLELPNNVEPKTVGYLYNIGDYYQNGDLKVCKPYWLWSTSQINGGAQSWMYSKKEVVYLEIVSSYPYLCQEPPVADDKELFQKFIDNYKPILCTELTISTIKNWIDQCKYIDETIDRPSKRKS